jgi:hypothetical protein
MSNYRTTIAGAVSVFGSVMFAAPLTLAVAGVEFPKRLIVTFMAVGFVSSAVGKALQALFSADAKHVDAQVQNLKSDVKTSIDSGNTDILKKTDIEMKG